MLDLDIITKTSLKGVRVPSFEEWEEFYQIAFLGVLEAQKKLDTTRPEPMQAWFLTRAARNAVVDYIRKTRAIHNGCARGIVKAKAPRFIPVGIGFAHASRATVFNDAWADRAGEKLEGVVSESIDPTTPEHVYEAFESHRDVAAAIERAIAGMKPTQQAFIRARFDEQPTDEIDMKPSLKQWTLKRFRAALNEELQPMAIEPERVAAFVGGR